MKCERCGCEIGLSARVGCYHEYSTDCCVALLEDNRALRRQLDALQPKPERFATARGWLRNELINVDDMEKDVKDLLQAFDEAVAIDTVERWQTWHNKWGNK